MEVIGRRYDTGEVARLVLRDGLIASIDLVVQESSDDLPWIAPALVDLQVNGYGGQEFSSPDLTAEKVAEVVEALNPQGVGRFCPTVTTNSRETLLHAMRTIAAACERWPEVAQRVAGIHLEGPYISREDGARGAHPLEHCRPPDWDELEELQQAAGGRIKIVTLSPEYESAAESIRRAAAAGIVVAIGHTSATPEQIHAAAAAGAKLSTHLGNGAHRVLPRHPNYLWAQLADDRLTASLICDGHHLPADVIQSFVRAKQPQRCILVSDLSGLAGMPPGRYPSHLCDLEILPDGRLVIAGQSQLLAGASRPLIAGVAGVMRGAGLGLAAAIDLATQNPATLLGESALLAVDAPADLVLLHVQSPGPLGPQGELAVVKTIIRGRRVYG